MVQGSAPSKVTTTKKSPPGSPQRRTPTGSPKSGSPSRQNAIAGLVGNADAAPDAISHVWVPDAQEAWSVARIESLAEDDAFVSVTLQRGGGLPFNVRKTDCRVWDPSHALYLDDAARLNNLHEAALLNLLRTRFESDDIYTYTGNVLISVNPYKDIPLLYNMPLTTNSAGATTVATTTTAAAAAAANSSARAGSKRRPSRRVPGGESDDEDAADGGSLKRSKSNRRASAVETVLDTPHVYAIADKARTCMMNLEGSGSSGGRRGSSSFNGSSVIGVNQSIIITGESGAGKTEAAKYVMRYLITASRVLTGGLQPTVTPSVTAAGPGGAGGETAAAANNAELLVESALLQSTTVLEAFGNAKTVRNDNSSRFGKYIKLQYSSEWKLAGARTLHFLLEKSRLVHQDAAERNYHVFYQLCRGLGNSSSSSSSDNAVEGKLSNLKAASEYAMLNQGGVYTQSEDVDDGVEFKKLCSALTTLGVGSDIRVHLWKLLASLLHMGNVQFVARSDDEQADSAGTTHKVDLSAVDVSVKDIADALGLPGDELVDCIRTRRTQTGHGTTLDIPLDAVQSKDNLDGLIKHIYGQVFSWLVGKINTSHEIINSSKGGNGADASTVAFIGILDIFGFEIMNRNSFEQLCINFANEVLQQQFNHHVFVLEQDTYEREGLDWTVISFKDNQGVIDLISKRPTGLLVQLEEIGLLGRKADNKALLQMYHNTHLASNEHYSKPRFEAPEFIVHHFAGAVTYDVTAFLQKNNDSLQDSLLDLLDKSSNAFLVEIMHFQDQEPLFDPNSPAAQAAYSAPARRSSSITQGADNGANYGAMPSSPTSQNGGLPVPPGSRGRETGFNAISIPASGSTGNSSLSPASHRRLGSREDNKRAREGATGNSRVHQLATTVTVSRTFRGQLTSLMSTLRSTQPHYIKCIKPNNVKAPGGFSPHLVRQQLNYSGVLEVVRIRREAYPVRVPFAEFYDRFELLYTRVARQQARKSGVAVLPVPADASVEEAKSASKSILSTHIGTETPYFQVGHTQVFLKEEGLERLRRAIRDEYNYNASVIQGVVRRCATRALVKKRNTAALNIQKTARMIKERRQFQQYIQHVIAMQRMVRGGLVRKKFKGNREGAIKVQAVMRGAIERKRYKASKAAVSTLQRSTRQLLARRQAERQRNSIENVAALQIQAAWKVTKQQRELNNKHAAAARIQLAIRSYLRNTDLAHQVDTAFRAATEGHVNTVAAVIKTNPEVLCIRNRHDRFKLLLHAAALGGSTSLVSLLDPLPDDILARDSDGVTALHCAAASCKYELVKFLAAKANCTVHVGEGCVSNKGTMDLGGTSPNSPNPDERRATKRISLRIIGEAREAMNMPVARRRGSVLMSATPTASSGGNAGFNNTTGSIGGKHHHAHSSSVGSHLRGISEHEIPLGKEAPVHSGWLDKRRETGKWQKRWCIATETELKYYHTQKDYLAGKPCANSITLARAMLHKSNANGSNGTGNDSSDSPHDWKGSACFELHSSELLRSKKNKEGRLYFKATSEEDAFAWLVPLRVLCKDHNLTAAQGQGVTRLVDMQRRQALVSMVTNAGETPLHYVAKYPDASAAESVSIARIQIGAWLVENGATVNAANDANETVLHLALKNGHVSLAAALARKGGDLSLKTSAGVSCMDMLSGPEEVEQVVVGYYKAADQNLLLPPPVKMSGLTYLTFHVEKLAMQSTDKLSSPLLTVSVYDSASGKRVEKAQDITAPVVTRPSYLWWSANWHMQNPLENMGPACMVVFEFKDQNTATGEVKTLGWAAYHLNEKTATSHETSLEMYHAPIDLKMVDLTPVDLFMSGDIMLTTNTASAAAADATVTSQ